MIKLITYVLCINTDIFGGVGRYFLSSDGIIRCQNLHHLQTVQTQIILSQRINPQLKPSRGFWVAGGELPFILRELGSTGSYY